MLARRLISVHEVIRDNTMFQRPVSFPHLSKLYIVNINMLARHQISVYKIMRGNTMFSCSRESPEMILCG